MGMNDGANLKSRQEASAKVERQMRDFLLDFTPVREIKIGDMQIIAAYARTIAFEAMDTAERERLA